jgi:hypothetical protein
MIFAKIRPTNFLELALGFLSPRIFAAKRHARPRWSLSPTEFMDNNLQVTGQHLQSRGKLSCWR